MHSDDGVDVDVDVDAHVVVVVVVAHRYDTSCPIVVEYSPFLLPLPYWSIQPAHIDVYTIDRYVDYNTQSSLSSLTDLCPL